MQKVFSVLFLLSILLIQCKSAKREKEYHEKENVAGGPCSYKEESYTATVLAIKKISDNYYDIQFLLKPEKGTYSNLPDTMMLSALDRQTGPVEESRIKRDSIVVGKKCRYYIQEIVSGSCTPLITGFSCR
jgi:hypothetical protein